MKKIILILSLLSVTLFSCLLTASAASPVPSDERSENRDDELEETNPQAKLHATVEKWLQTIAEQHKLTSWHQADYVIEPLGPGTHGWLVHITRMQSPVGYMVVQALPDGGFRLAEYGVGDRPLFSAETLRESLVQHGLIPAKTSSEDLSRLLLDMLAADSDNASALQQEEPLVIERHYLFPFAAYWKVFHKELKQSAYFDAVTGEQYPLSKDPAKKSTEESATIRYQSTNLRTLKDHLQLAKFDPYEDLGWVVEDPLHIQSAKDITTPLANKHRITLTVELYNDIVLLPYPVIGYADWEHSETYLLLYSEGLRYVPLIDAVKYGQLYLEQND